MDSKKLKIKKRRFQVRMAQHNRNKNKNTHGGQIVTFVKGKRKFQVITNKGAVLKYNDGKISLDNVLLTEQIFGKTLNTFANSSDLQLVFGTQETMECAEYIIKNGKLQYTKQERKQFMEEKRKQIATYIHDNFIDPISKYPHPTQRILNCMKDCGVKIDADGDTMRQSLYAIQKMNGVLMFTMNETIIVVLTIKHIYYGKVCNIINKLVNVTHRDWNNIGCVLTIQCTPNNWQNVQKKIFKATNDGDFDFKDITVSSKEKGNNNTHNKVKQKRRKGKLLL